MTLFCYDETEHHPTDAERREAAESLRRETPSVSSAEPPLLPFGVPANGVSQLVGAFSRGGRR